MLSVAPANRQDSHSALGGLKKINSYAATLLGIIALVLVFGVTLSSEAVHSKKENDQRLAELQSKVAILEEKFSILDEEKSATEKKLAVRLKEIEKLKKELKKLVEESQEKGSLASPINFLASLTSTQEKSEIKTTKVVKKEKKKEKKYYTGLEIAGFAYEVEYTSGQTAFDQLQKAATKHGFDIQYTTYDFGIFIDCIGGICGDAHHFWALYENGEMSMVGASDLILEINDKISWVYTSF